MSGERAGAASANDLEQKLRGQVESWRKKLLDLGNRNALINCSFHATRGVVEIVHPDAETVWRKLAAEGEAGVRAMRFPWRRDLVPPPPDQAANTKPAREAQSADEIATETPKEWNPPLDDCLASIRLRDTDLLTGIGDKAIDRRLRTLDAYAQLSMSEQGVHSLYVAFGFLKWFESKDSEQELRSPLMLVPVALSRASADAPWELTEAEDDAVDNLCLRQRLIEDFGLELPPLPDINQLEEESARQEFLDAIRKAIAPNARWVVEDRCALGRFAFPKVAMWKDLGDHAASVTSHPLCRSIGGDSSIPPQRAFGSAADLPDASRLDDEVPPGEVKAILDCDSSQLEAIVAARRGISFVLDGPPGTGKSQTIANIIADALAEGRRVLFVSEKISALEVVKRRLDSCGLGDFCLECHSSKVHRKTVLDELQWCLNIPAEVYGDVLPKLEEARKKRDALNHYVRSIHRPRNPLGLSPFELYGHVTRLGRLGMANRSRCALPEPGGVERATFDQWLHLLGRAKDVGEVVSRYNVHPWRSCKMTSRSLSFSDDLQHHFGILCHALGSIEDCTRPLIDEGLLPAEVTAANLNDVLKLLRDSLQAPEIPLSWFGSPLTIAEAVIGRHAATDTIREQSSILTDFLEDVVGRFPDDAAGALTLQKANSWTKRLKEPLPDQAKRQLETLERHVTQLRRVAELSSETESALSTLFDQLRISPKPLVSVSAISKFVHFARLLPEAGTMRPGWFESFRWSGLRQVSCEAIESLENSAALAAKIAERIPADRMDRLAKATPDLPALEAAWTTIQTISPSGTLGELDTLARTAHDAATTLKHAAGPGFAVAQALGCHESNKLTFRLARALSRSIDLIAERGMLHGKWADPAARQRIRNACDAAIGDLKEAEEIRSDLQERLSHRAFKRSAADLVHRSGSYSSFMRRLFGGYANYRREVAELYAKDVPGTKNHLRDFDRLRAFHRRMTTATELADELTDVLPTGHMAEDLANWTRISESLTAFEAFATAVPDWTAALRPVVIEWDREAMRTDADRLAMDLAKFQKVIENSSLGEVCDDSLALTDLADRCASIADAAKLCSEAWGSTAVHFSSPPSTFEGLLADLRVVHRHHESLVAVMTSFDRERDLMPLGAIPTERGCWQRILAGVEVAECVSGVVRSSKALQDALCEGDQIDLTSTVVAGDALDVAYQHLSAALTENGESIVFSPPGEAVVEPDRRPLPTLQLIVDAASEEFCTRVQQLTALISVIRPDRDVGIGRLPKCIKAIGQMRQAIRDQSDAESVLKNNGVTCPGDFGSDRQDAAAWLRDRAHSDEITPLLAAVASDTVQRERARQVASQIKQSGNDEFMESWAFLKSIFDMKSDVSSGVTILNEPVGKLGQHLSTLQAELGSLDEWLKYSRWRRDMSESGFEAVVDELLAERFGADEVADVVAIRFYRKLFDQLATEDRTLGDFEIESHERIRDRFRQLDEWEIKAAATRIRQYQLGRDDRPRSGWSAGGTSELGILQRETQKKRRHMPLRKLFAEIPSVLQKLKPCIMMSPLSVSTFLQSDEIRFDLVIFDEASQVFPWDAIGAIYRGAQLIVAGDEKQLPPTNFFNRGDLESESEDEDIGDFESILSLCKSINMPSKRLRWHYRSRREPLIAFSNRHFYQGDLVTFPSIRDASGNAVRLELVREGRWVDRKNLPEAERIVDLIIEHLRSRPETSLGVIAFNASQQHAIEDVLYERRRNDPVIDGLFDVGSTEPLFIKNLENVQGDERDVIFLSMGYAYNEQGKFLKNFGPLTMSGGERRLNVAVTRAREEVVFVASVRAADMDLAGSKSEGSHLLKGYLEYAEKGVASLATARVDSLTGEAESPFEAEVAAALVRHGLNPVPQVGCGGFRIDLALSHPNRPGEFCLGIECDGATYHSSRTARDRDRLRQAVLEDLGWQIVRIWSTDWVRSPERQVGRILSAYEAAISRSSGSGNGTAGPVKDFEGEDSDLLPRFINVEAPSGQTFSDIDDVPDGQIRASVKLVLVRSGATDWDDLVKLVARELGFARTGKKIRDRLETIFNTELQSGAMRWVGDRITCESASDT